MTGEILILVGTAGAAFTVARAVLGSPPSTTTPVRVSSPDAATATGSRWSERDRSGEYVGKLDAAGEATLLRWGRPISPGSYSAVFIGTVDGEALDASAAITIGPGGVLAVSRRALSPQVFVIRRPVGVDVVVRPAGHEPGDRVSISGTLSLVRQA